MNDNLDHSSDSELIHLYVHGRRDSDAAMRTLVERHSQQTHKRFLAKVKNENDAKDLQQELWVRVAKSLDRYKDEGKFANYLSKLISNVVIDFYRKSGREKEVIAQNYGQSEDGDYDVSSYQDFSQDVEESAGNSELVEHLTTVLVPGLPVEQRAAWLLRHESDYWEPGSRFEWHHLAELNGMTENEVSNTFESARHKIMLSSVSTTKGGVPLEEIELLVFLVWTQSQRLDKSKSYTFDYFAELLGQPVNTMKTRYRTAQKALSDGLSAFMEN